MRTARSRSKRRIVVGLSAEETAEAVGSTPEELTTAFDGVKFFDLAENKQQFQGDLLKTLQDVSQVAQSIGLFEKLPDLAKLLLVEAYQ